MKFLLFFFIVNYSIGKILSTENKNQKERKLDVKDDMDDQYNLKIFNLENRMSSLHKKIGLLTQKFDLEFDTVDLLMENKLKEKKEHYDEKKRKIIEEEYKVNLLVEPGYEDKIKQKLERRMKQMEKQKGHIRQKGEKIKDDALRLIDENTEKEKIHLEKLNSSQKKLELALKDEKVRAELQSEKLKKEKKELQKLINKKLKKEKNAKEKMRNNLSNSDIMNYGKVMSVSKNEEQLKPLINLHQDSNFGNMIIKNNLNGSIRRNFGGIQKLSNNDNFFNSKKWGSNEGIKVSNKNNRSDNYLLREKLKNKFKNDIKN